MFSPEVGDYRSTGHTRYLVSENLWRRDSLEILQKSPGGEIRWGLQRDCRVVVD